MSAWFKTQSAGGTLTQPCSGHATRQSFEICSRLALAEAQQRYDATIAGFPA